MKNYSQLLMRLYLVGNDPQHGALFCQAAEAIEQLSSSQGELSTAGALQRDCEPSDHEAEGAMLYVMSRGKSAA